MPRTRSRSRSRSPADKRATKTTQRRTRRKSSVSSSESKSPSPRPRRSSRSCRDPVTNGHHTQRAPAQPLHPRSSEAGKREMAVEPNSTTQNQAQVQAVASAADNPGDFKNFPELSQATVSGLVKRGITALFPVQSTTFRRIFNGEDLIVRDLTGSGKTLGFCLPMIERFRQQKAFGKGKPLAMILAPTRELAQQISKELIALMHRNNEYSVLTVYGGTSLDEQVYALRRGVDIFVGTCGRVVDHINRNTIDLSAIKFVILDEADQMLNMGFMEQVEMIIDIIKKNGPQDTQSLLFSATVPTWVKNVARNMLKPGHGSVDLVSSLKNKTSKTVEHMAICCPYQNRISTLADILICYGGAGQTIVFTSTKKEANQLQLADKIKKDIQVLHGDIPQNLREVTLKRFKEKKFQVLVATDVASRGLDIPNVDLVIQIEPPKETETYIHRSGRTARAGLSGKCITFYTMKQKPLVQMIEHRAGINFTKIGIPQPNDVIKATQKETIANLSEVHESVIKNFEEAATDLIEQEKGDYKRALAKTLALLSGHHKEVLQDRSLLNGYEDMVTFQIILQRPFYSVSMVWNVLRRSVPEQTFSQIKGMRAFKDMTGACFDVVSDAADQFEEIFKYMAEERRCDFTVSRCKELPELKESDERVGGQQGYGNQGGYGQRQGYGGVQTRSSGGYNQGGGYGGQSQGGYGQQRGGGYGGQGGRGGYGQQSQGGYGQQSQGGYGQQRGGYGGGQGGAGGAQRNQDASVFVGNLGDVDQRGVESIFSTIGLNAQRVRVLMDDQGRCKGAAFVDFGNANEAQEACKMDGREGGPNRKRLKVNLAGNKPGGR